MGWDGANSARGGRKIQANTFFFNYELKKEKKTLPGINHTIGNIGCDCPAIKIMIVDWRHDLLLLTDWMLESPFCPFMCKDFSAHDNM